VRVAIFLPSQQTAQVTAAMQVHDELRVADSWDALETLVRVEPLNAVVLNPAADGTMDPTSACKLIRKYASIPFVAYVPLDASYLRAIAHMANDGLRELIVVRTGDSPHRFRETLERVGTLQELAALVDTLQPWLRRLPNSLAQVLIDALYQPHKYGSAEDVAASAGITVSALYRGFRSAGLNSPKSFVVGARVFRGCLYLRDEGFFVRDVAAKLGYSHPRIFAHQLECVLGERPSTIRRTPVSNDSADRLVEWFRTPGLGAEHARSRRHPNLSPACRDRQRSATRSTQMTS
jgi:AraC-like DNA-binding protein